ncbi:uncharacterized protein LOC132548162 [Ylistrum balloti]|uniref:uncharacterized protein LOC132548162 n=1 Tax=Ylistrum balloti TaxID=509963 RepID=UPI002905C7BD|nr:uncharacterized protein LOC132548162 [Ylistrum balloti]
MPGTPTARVMEVEGVDTSKIEDFPLSGLKVVGAVQIGLGAICITLGLVDILMYVFEDQETLFATSATPISSELQEARSTLMSLTISSAPIWCGLWFCVAGAMAACMSQRNKSTLNYFKLTFLVLSIMNAAIFGPVCMTITTVVSVMRHSMDAETYRWLIPILTAFFSFNEIAFAIVSASICCCCSPLRTNRVKVLLATQREDSKLFTVSNKLAEPEPEPQKKPQNVNKKPDRWPKKENKPIQEEPVVIDEEPYFPTESVTNHRDRPTTKDSVTSYVRLKRLALPSSEQVATF